MGNKGLNRVQSRICEDKKCFDPLLEEIGREVKDQKAEEIEAAEGPHWLPCMET
jgi:hypothetical protein